MGTSTAVQAVVSENVQPNLQSEPSGSTASIDEFIFHPPMFIPPFATPQEEPQTNDINMSSSEETSILGLTALMEAVGDDSGNSLDQSGVEVNHENF